MITGAEIRSAIVNVIKDYLKASSLRSSKVCKVINLNFDYNDLTNSLLTVDVAPIDGTAIIEDVKLNTDNNTYGYLLIPSLNSLVTVSFNSDSDAYVAMVSQVDKIYLNGNDYGGLVEVQPLVTKLNNAEKTINKLINVLTGWTPVANDGGAALKAAFAAALITDLVETQKVDLENTTVNHGKGNLT